MDHLDVGIKLVEADWVGLDCTRFVAVKHAIPRLSKLHHSWATKIEVTQRWRNIGLGCSDWFDEIGGIAIGVCRQLLRRNFGNSQTKKFRKGRKLRGKASERVRAGKNGERFKFFFLDKLPSLIDAKANKLALGSKWKSTRWESG